MNLFKRYYFNGFILIFKLFLILFLLNFSFANSHNNYADIDIYLTQDGRVSIFGDTNVKEILNISNSYEYTFKNKEYWILNFTTKESFEDFIFSLHMPREVEINYIKTTPNFRIVNSDDELEIIGTGSNKPISILIQYKLNNLSNGGFYDNLSNFEKMMIFSFLLVFFFSVFVLLYLFKVNKAKIKDLESKKFLADNILNSIDNKEKGIDIVENRNNNKKVFVSIFPKRQQDILKILKEKEKVTQKELEDLILIPKSSISRNVKSLEVKGIIRKERIGASNYLFLNEKLELVFEED